MNRRAFVAGLGAVLAAPLAAEAQVRKIARIGVLAAGSPTMYSARYEAFRQGLRELGYVEGKTIAIEYRYAEGKFERLPDLAAELARLNVDVILASSAPETGAAKRATMSIPIVFGLHGDPVGTGHVASLAHPGGNITGLATMAPDLSGKRLELLKEAIPKLTRAAVLWNPANQGGPRQWQETQSAARKLRLTLQSLEVRDPNDVPKAFAAMMQNHPDALLIIASPITTAFRPIIIEFATKQRIPTMFSTKADVEAGGLISYAPSLTDSFRRAARYVDKVLKGANPGELPIEEPTKFELVINLKSAKSLKLTIPKTLLLQADQQIQ
jgi:putative tryptophan/tyrosine transport system substrate-binding protein